MHQSHAATFSRTRLPRLPRFFSSRVTRALAAATIGSAVVVGVGACGAGQISQTANQAAAVNGSFATRGAIAIRDAHVVYPPVDAQDAFVNGGPFELAFLISNNSAYQNDRLVSITLPGGGSAVVDGSRSIPATKSLRAGQPSKLLAPSSAVVASEKAEGSVGNSADPSETRIGVTITDAGTQVRPGLTVPIDFTFERAGRVRLNVPVDAGTEMPRDPKSFLNREALEDNEAGSEKSGSGNYSDQDTPQG